MITTLDGTPQLEYATRPARDRRWEVRTSSSLLSMRAALPFGRIVTAEFSNVTGVVDVAVEGNEAIALLISARSLDTQPEDVRALWLSPHLLDAQNHPRLALVLDDFARSGDGWIAGGRLHVRRQVIDVDAAVEFDGLGRRCTIAFAVDPVPDQPVASIRRPGVRRIDVVADLALVQRARKLLPELIP